MVKPETILIIGLGAIGSIYAAKFHKYSPESVRVLLTPDRIGNYKNNPLIFNGEVQDFNYVLENDSANKADLIIVATKNNSFLQSVNMIKSFIKEDTIILSLLNGISSEKTLIEEFGGNKVLYSYYIGHASLKEGRKVFHDGIGTIVFGDLNNQKYSCNVEKVKKIFDRAGIDYKIPEDMLSSMWLKFVMNVGINQATAIKNADYKKMQESKETRKLALDLMNEAVEIANKMGIKGADTFIEQTFKLIDKMPPELKSSMFQDVGYKRETEVDIFAGEIIKLGKKYRVATPANEYAYKTIKEIEATFRKTKGDLSLNLH